VIEGHAHGVIIRAEEQRGISTTGRCYTLPFAQIWHRMPSELRFEHDRPFLELAASYLKDGIGLPDVIEHLLSENAAEIQRQERFIARRTLARGVTCAADVAIQAIARGRRDEAHDLVDVAAAQWFPEDGAESLARQLTVPLRQPRAAAVNTECPELATLYVRRAGFAHHRAISWDCNRIEASWPPGVSEDRIVDDVTAGLCWKLLSLKVEPEAGDDCAQYVAEINAELGRMFDPAREIWDLVFALLPVTVPRAAIDRLAAMYPALAIVVWTGRADLVTANAPLVKPELPKPGHLDDWRAARRRISRHFPERS
jgi:hypothetical protein